MSQQATTEQFGEALRMVYSNTCREWRISLSSMPGRELAWPDDFAYEIGAFMYFIFDFAVSSASSASKAKRIMEAFLSADPPPSTIANLLSERCFEYSNALRTKDKAEGLFKLGQVFARHTGHDKDSLVIALASTHFQSTFSFLVDQVKETLPRLR